MVHTVLLLTLHQQPVQSGFSMQSFSSQTLGVLFTTNVKTRALIEAGDSRGAQMSEQGR